MPNIIELNKIKKIFKDEFELNVDYLKLSNEYIYYLSGDNGSGKSVLLRIIGDIDTNYEGIKKSSVNKSRILYLTNSEISFPYLTLRENIELFESIYSMEINESKKYILYSDNQINRLSIESSLGMKTKVGLSMLLKNNFWDLIILDETISAIDQNSRKTIMYELEERLKEGSIILITTHDDLDLASEKIKKIFINNGEVYEKK
ncbi:MAG: ATP-binding cassette domain-containing protein [Helcococcus sp.]|nr:ATP-binding cassette domain-containing protein [Helcococcus sp.]